MVFHWYLSDSKSSHLFSTLLSVLADRNNAIVWMMSARPTISNSSRPFKQPLRKVPRAPIIINITISLIFSSLFYCSGKISVFVHFSFSLIIMIIFLLL